MHLIFSLSLVCAVRLLCLFCGRVSLHAYHSIHLRQVEAQEYLTGSDCPEYLRKAEKRLTEESERVTAYLDSSTEAKITAVVETELIGNQVGLEIRWRLSHASWCTCNALLSLSCSLSLVHSAEAIRVLTRHFDGPDLFGCLMVLGCTRLFFMENF